MLERGNVSRTVEVIDIVHAELDEVQRKLPAIRKPPPSRNIWLKYGRDRSQAGGCTSSRDKASHPGLFQNPYKIAVPVVPLLANGAMSLRISPHFRSLRSPASKSS